MKKLLSTAFAVTLIASGTACSSSSDDNASGGSSAGGSAARGGSTSGGAANGGTPIGNGGSLTGNGGSVAAGGATAGGASPGSGGKSNGGSSNGGSANGGANNAGAGPRGGATGTGGASPNGGSANGGANNGGANTAGSANGGRTGSGGDTGQTCPLPSTFKWTSGGPVVTPKSGWVALKDFTHVFFNNKHIVYMTTHDQANWGSAMMTFTDWPAAATATQTQTSFGIAPTLFYFTPKDTWVIAYQWGPHKFSYRTSSDPTNPSGWSGEKSLYNTALPSTGTGPIDQTVICDTAKCYLYYAGDNGHIYKSSMAIGSFPGEFPAAADSGIQGTSQNLFEAVQVYSIKGSNKYLMIVEAQGSARYFRAWTATSLDGPWTLLTDNFAIKSNVTFSQEWTNDISHGDLVRSSPDETFPIDPCNLQLVFQGRDPNSKVDYGLLPYRMGLLTLVK